MRKAEPIQNLDPVQEVSLRLTSHPELLPHSLKVFLTVGKIIDALPEQSLTGREVKNLLTAAIFHDIGKSTWKKDWFIKRRHQLSSDEWAQMQNHPRDGARLLISLFDMSEKIIDLVAQHHERPGGTGYPKQTEPDFLTLIIAAADVYAACTEKRNYRFPGSWGNDYALREVAKFAPLDIYNALLLGL